MAVLFLMLIGKKADHQFRGRQAGGAVLMVVALIIVLL
jgi:hypothetical protein